MGHILSPLTSTTELSLPPAAAKLAQYRVLLEMPPKFMPLKIKCNSPKAYQLGLTFMRPNCEKGKRTGVQGRASLGCPGAAESPEQPVSPKADERHLCPRSGGIFHLAPTEAGTETSSVARKAWQIPSAAHVSHPNPHNTTPWCRKLGFFFLTFFFFCQASMPGQILAGTIATNPSANPIS